MFKKSDYKASAVQYCGSEYKGDLRAVFRCTPISKAIHVADGNIMIYNHRNRKIHTNCLRLPRVDLLSKELWVLLRNTKKVIKAIKNSHLDDDYIAILENCHNLYHNTLNKSIIKTKYPELYDLIMLLWQYDGIIEKITNTGAYQSYGNTIRYIINTNFSDSILRLLLLPVALNNTYGSDRHYMYGYPVFYYMVDNKIYMERHLYMIQSYKSVLVFPMDCYDTETCNSGNYSYTNITMLYNIGDNTPRQFANIIRHHKYE